MARTSCYCVNATDMLWTRLRAFCTLQPPSLPFLTSSAAAFPFHAFFLFFFMILEHSWPARPSRLHPRGFLHLNYSGGACPITWEPPACDVRPAARHWGPPTLLPIAKAGRHGHPDSLEVRPLLDIFPLRRTHCPRRVKKQTAT